MSQDTVIKHARDMMAKAVEHTLSEFNKLHTGKASPSMVENLQGGCLWFKNAFARSSCSYYSRPAERFRFSHGIKQLSVT